MPKNCATAISQFFVKEILVHGDVLFEFLAVGGRKESRYPSQKTPQKFTYGELCHFQCCKLLARDYEVQYLQL